MGKIPYRLSKMERDRIFKSPEERSITLSILCTFTVAFAMGFACGILTMLTLK